jgi:hypothetical protein
MNGSRLLRVKSVVAPALLVILQLSLFGAHTIYAGNEAEFTAPFWALVAPPLIAGLVILGALLVIALVLPGVLFRPYVVLLFALGLLLWVQASFLFPDYGPLDGSAIDWSLQAWRNPHEIAMWIVVPLVCVAAAKYLFGVAPFASAVLVGVQGLALMVSVTQAESPAPARWRGPSESMFELSKSHNVIHIVLDAFQSDLFQEILDENRQALDRSFSGAVFFADHAGAFPTTMVSIPAMLSGDVYRMERPLPRYVREHFDGGSVFKTLQARGYRIDNISEIPYDGKSSKVYRMPRPYVSYGEYKTFAAWQLADLSLFRHAPHVFRPWIYNDQSWRLQTVFGPGDTQLRRHFPVNGAAILHEFAERMRPAVDGPVYKFVHVGIPHRPVIVTADCGVADAIRPLRQNYKDQTHCAVMRTAQILDRLKELGLYDNALIVISSDHGIGFPPPRFHNDRELPPGPLSVLSGKSMALLIVKTPGARGPVRVSHAPTAITDVPATIMDALGVPHTFPGTSALKLPEDASRVRSFAMYDWENDGWKHDYFDALDLLEVRGPLLDGKSWTFVDTLYPPGATTDNRMRGVYDVQRSRSGYLYRWSRPRAYFHAPPGARQLELQIRSIAPKPQTVTFTVAGHTLDKVTLADQSWVVVKHALAPDNTGATWVGLQVDAPWRPRGEARVLGVQVRDVNWTP